MRHPSKEIAVIGGGIVGMMSCLQLLQRGWKVTLFDRVPPGSPDQTSWGNAGSISVGNIMPLGKPGFLLDGASKVISFDSPLLMPFGYLHKSLPWVFKVFQQSGKEKVAQIAHNIGELNVLSGEVWRQLVEEMKLQRFVSENGWLKLYETDKSFEKTADERQLMAEMEIPFRVMDQNELREHDPSLSPVFSKAILQTSSLGVNSPGQLLAHLTAIAVEKGARIVVDDIKSLGKSAGHFILRAPETNYKTPNLLLASGAWSAEIAAELGHSFPLETERGYHLFFNTEAGLKGPSINMDRYVAMSPMEGGLRVTSCVELGGLSRTPNYGRMRRLSKYALKALPSLNEAEPKEWMGYRPSLPDSKPVIGRSYMHQGLYFAFGNGHLGLTQSAGTGRLIAEIINSEPTSIETAAFAASRFDYAV